MYEKIGEIVAMMQVHNLLLFSYSFELRSVYSVVSNIFFCQGLPAPFLPLPSSAKISRKTLGIHKNN